MKKSEIQELVTKTKWYHGWEIVPGIFTGGNSFTNPKSALTRYGLDSDLEGKRALDIAAWDGPYSFELERRGAEVVSYDIQDPDATAYNTAKRILNSECAYVRGNVYDLSPAVAGKFDIVLYLGVFYHLKHPLIALENIRSVLKDDGIMVFEGANLDYAWNVDRVIRDHRDDLEKIRHLPITYFTSGEYAGSWSNWYIPTRACVQEWHRATGFREVSSEIHTTSSRVYGIAERDPEWNPHEHGLSNANAKADQSVRH